MEITFAQALIRAIKEQNEITFTPELEDRNMKVTITNRPKSPHFVCTTQVRISMDALDFAEIGPDLILGDTVDKINTKIKENG